MDTDAARVVVLHSFAHEALVKTGYRLCLSLSVLMGLMGCSTPQFTTLVIYDTPSAFVRLEVDRTVGPAGHSHPAHVSRDQMAAVLQGIVVIEPVTRMPVYDDLSQPRRHPAFTEKETGMLAPILSAALAKATPEEIVAFYETKPSSGIRREVTSGGLFVHDDELHLILANYRSPTHYMADPGVADTTDDRLTPLRSIAPQRGHLEFEPREARREPDRSLLEKLFQRERREIIVLISRIPSDFTHPTKDAK